MQLQSSMIARDAAVAGSRVSAVGSVLLAATLGVFLLWGVGFSPIDVVHNAAHDVRHSNAFPCH
jgi:cobalt transporter subunit CbtB